MTHYVLDPQEPDEAAIRAAAAVLHTGGVVAYPTETLYALAVDPCSDRAVRNLLEVKDRDPSSAIALIAADGDQARAAGHFGSDDWKLAERFWPGPLTIVVPANEGISHLLRAGRTTVGIRVSAHPVAQALAAIFGACITATSANLSGRPAASTATEVAASLGGRIDVLIDAGPTPGGPPSTVVEIVEGAPRLHRAGAVAWDRVLESLQ